jgi:cyclophilin family peptidyl-prolyl cis-trans isomerase
MAEDTYYVTIVGKSIDPIVQKMKAVAQFVKEAHPLRFEFETEEYFETQYEERLRELRHVHGGATKQARPSQPFVMAALGVTDTILYFKTPDDFFIWIHRTFKMEDTTNLAFYKRRANKDSLKHMLTSGNKYFSIAFAIGRSPAEAVSFELFGSVVPKTVNAFLALLKSGKLLGSTVHRVVRGGWVQAGDTTGTGGFSQFIDGSVLPDESVNDLDAAGLLCLANSGPDTNGSQFFITVKPLPFLNGKYVVIGRVISGMRVVRLMNAVQTDMATERPIDKVRLTEISPDLTENSTLKAEVMEELEEEAPLHEKEEAAVKMQAMFKGKQIRRKELVPASPKEDLSPKSAAKKKKSLIGIKKAPTKIQTKAQKEAEEDEQAAIKIQATIRGKQTRKEMAARSPK